MEVLNIFYGGLFMKRFPKRMISLLVCIILLGMTFIPVLAQKPQSAYPTVYITGQAPGNVKMPDGSTAKCGDVPDGYVTEAVKDCLPYLSDAILKNEWDAYYEKLVSWVTPLYDDVRLDKNGDPVNGVGLQWSWHPGSLPSNIKSSYGLWDYAFQYDWRLDPCYNADILSEYVKDVLRATQSNKVNIIGRCEGACLVDAYLAEYGHGSVNKLVYYTQADGGVDGVGEALSGQITIDSDGLERWSATNLNLEDEFLNEFLSATIIAAENTGLLKLAGMGALEFYEQKLKQVLPEIILASYGTMPASYALASVQTGVPAIDFVFAGKEDEYAGLIAKLKNYHYNVRLKQDELLLAAAKDGVQVCIVAKYGFQTKPFTDKSDELSDGACLLKYLSKGATAAPVGEKFSDAYIASADARGDGDCISPDKQVDASTCLFKDTTWIIKYIEHREFPAVIDNIIIQFLRSESPMTVYTNPAFPRFMIYDREAGVLRPMTEENSSHEMWDNFTDVGYFTSIVRFFRIIYRFLRDYFYSLFVKAVPYANA